MCKYKCFSTNIARTPNQPATAVPHRHHAAQNVYCLPTRAANEILFYRYFSELQTTHKQIPPRRPPEIHRPSGTYNENVTRSEAQ